MARQTGPGRAMDRQALGEQWSTGEVDIPTGRSESQVRLEGLSENLRETLKHFEAGVKGHHGTLT